MRLSRTISVKFVLIGVVLTLLAGLIAATLIERNSPEKLFARFVVTPIPQSVQFLDSKFVHQREWRAFFHIQISPQDFLALLNAKRYNRLQENLPAYKSFIETTHLFRNVLPAESLLLSYEVYEFWHDPDGTVSYLIANHEHSEVFVLCVRI